MNKKQSTLIFLRYKDQILLAMKKRDFGKGKLNGAGGKINPDETIEEALIRECIEEIGVTPLKYHKVAENEFSWPDEKGREAGFFTHVYLCDAWHGVLQETDEMAPEWFSINNIPYDKMWQDDILWLPKVLAGKKVTCSFTFDKNYVMLSHVVEIVPGF
jgi:8-oxo-dGTP diphosphatase